MSNSDAEIREAVEYFVEQLKGLIQRAALESVQAALAGGGSGPVRQGSELGRAASAVRSKRQKRAKRTAEELDSLIKRLRTYVVKNPGQRIEQIGRSLDVPTKELVLPVKKLMSDKQISTKGERRATVYFAK